ncbi:MAG: MBL fold metallo-hydrolase [Pseudomonadota bacterium]
MTGSINHVQLAALRAERRQHGENWFRNNYNRDRRGVADFIRWMRDKRGLWPAPKRFPVDRPDSNWLAVNRSDSTLTWIGHVTFLFQHRGLNVLTDPVFSERASPLSFVGPKRYTPPAMHVDHLPPIDIVLISHNHYDHLDRDAVRHIARRNEGRTRFLVPLRLAGWFRREGIDNVVELDWWDETLPLGEKPGSVGRNKVYAWFVPAQHFSGRGVNDRNATLWGGWVLEIDGFRLYFAGDTGYGKDFADIGAVFGGFDLSLIPIGAYEPQWLMGSVHVNPEDAVRIHRDVKSKHSIGMHWGTFILTDEPVDEPPRRLARARSDQGLADGDFVVMRHGEVRRWSPGCVPGYNL